MAFLVSRQRHLHNAGLIWVLMGTMLTARGVVWVFGDVHTHRWLAIVLPMAVLLGLLKGGFVLRKAARRVTRRIRTLADHTPVWHLFSPAMYGLVVGMMAFGIACRFAGAHWQISGFVGLLYLVVGIALITGSRTYWRGE